MTKDLFAQFKATQKQSWSAFAPLEAVTTLCAARLVKFSQLKPQDKVLDVGCGTGVVAITAARMGAHVSALDLSPVLIERAHENAAIAQVDIDMQEGDVESLPYADHTFDVVLSQFGHMFAPQPQLALQEMLRVLKPGGVIAFSTWPSHLFVGQFFSLTAKFSPPPQGVASPSLWGDPHFIREQFQQAVIDLTFDQDVMLFPTLSFGHYRKTVESTIGPVIKLVKESENDPQKLEQFRQELAQLFSHYYADNHIHQHYLLTRAKKGK